MMEEKLKFKKLSDNAISPTKATNGAAGFDLYATEDVYLPPGEWKSVATGICVEIPRNYYGQLASRSGLAFRDKVTVFAGVIDNDYRGEIGVLLQNWGKDCIRIRKGQRVGQIMIIRVHSADKFDEVKVLEVSSRNTDGFGSTGKF